MELGVTCWSPNKSKLSLMKELGCQQYYSVIEWCNIHKASNYYDWRNCDIEFELEEELGLKSIRCILHTPLWASGIDPNNCKFRPTSYPPRILEDYGKFCAELVKRYPGREWVLWGEPDNFPPREVPRIIQWASDPATYANMVKYAYVEMKKIDPSCQVSLGSLVGATLNGEFPTVVENGNTLNKLPFFEELLKLDIGDYCDIISIDLYCYGYGKVPNFIVGIRKIKELMGKYGVKKPIYITETGARITSSESKIAKEFNHEAVSEETQAGFLLKAYTIAKDAKIQKMFWHTIKDSGWGLVNRLNRKHMSYYAFRAIQRGILDEENK